MIIFHPSFNNHTCIDPHPTKSSTATSKSTAKRKRPKSLRPMSKRTVIKMLSILMTIVSQIKKKRKAIMSTRTSPTTRTKMMTMSPTSKVMTKTRTKTGAEMTLKRKNHLVKSVSTSCATLKKYTKNCVPKSKVPSTASSAAPATTTTATTIFASSVNKSTQVQGTQTMTTNGSGVTNAIAG